MFVCWSRAFLDSAILLVFAKNSMCRASAEPLSLIRWLRSARQRRKVHISDEEALVPKSDDTSILVTLAHSRATPTDAEIARHSDDPVNCRHGRV